ncbi:RCC1 domain-containing protein [Lentzea sp. NPDC059081]|uniref:RCC1 domain-containing protein n=1 Tax=Lentzea sp. NPDC059081 TaxID=3346719 RepID=UPI0036B11C6F
MMRRLVLPVAALMLSAIAVSSPAAAAAEPVASSYTPVTPLRVLDTRTGLGAAGPVGAGQSVVLDLSSRTPVGTTAVVLNVTATEPTSLTHVIVWPSGSPRPAASNLNVVAGESRPNLVTVRLDQSRKVSLYNNLGSVHLLADLAGHYTSGAGALYQPLPPTRALDTRDGTGVTPRNPDGSLPLNLSGLVPADATAVTFNLTATNVTANTHVIAWPHGRPRPDTSNLNLAPGDTRANLVTVALGTDRTVDLFNNLGGIDLVADLAGFYVPGEGLAYYPLDPRRVVDTRSSATIRPDNPLNLWLDADDSVPATASAVVMNVTATEATEATHVSVSPAWDFRSSTLNITRGGTVPNLSVVVLGMYGVLNIRPNAGAMHLIVDLAGYFAPAPSTCATGCVYGWGQSNNGSLGSGGGLGENQYFGEPTARPVSGLSGVTALAGRYALLADGTVRAWGPNNWGELGAGWHTYNGFASVPVRVKGLSGVTALAASGSNGYALRSDGTVWGWGYNYAGQAGPRTTPDDIVDLPVRIAGLDQVVAIAATAGTGYALRSDGTVWSWGNNFSGELGNGTTGGSSPAPVQVAGLTDVTSIVASGNARYALRSDGTVWSWGSNSEGQLGNGAGTGMSGTAAPVRDLTGVVSVAAAYATGFAIRADKTVVAWGSHYNGAAGVGFADRLVTVPTRIRNLSDGRAADVTKIIGTYALRADGSLWGWGSNVCAQLGYQDASDVAVEPKLIPGLPPVKAFGTTGSALFAIVS